MYHSENRIDHVVYVSEHRLSDYCAISGATLFSGRDDTEVTLGARVSHAKSFKTVGGAYLLAVGLSELGEVQILDGLTLTRQLSIKHSLIKFFDDFIVNAVHEEEGPN